MYRTIMIPVDIAHAERLAKALRTGADLAKLYGAELVYVGVTAPTPGSVAHNPAEYAEKLAAFAAAEAAEYGHAVRSQAVVSHDPTTDLDDALLRAVDETGADLVVMASHIPGLADYVWPSNGGKLAGHAKASVFVVRPG